jgi:hypothetical protein
VVGISNFEHQFPEFQNCAEWDSTAPAKDHSGFGADKFLDDPHAFPVLTVEKSSY